MNRWHWLLGMSMHALEIAKSCHLDVKVIIKDMTRKAIPHATDLEIDLALHALDEPIPNVRYVLVDETSTTWPAKKWHRVIPYEDPRVYPELDDALRAQIDAESEHGKAKISLNLTQEVRVTASMFQRKMYLTAERVIELLRHDSDMFWDMEHETFVDAETVEVELELSDAKVEAYLNRFVSLDTTSRCEMYRFLAWLQDNKRTGHALVEYLKSKQPEGVTIDFDTVHLLIEYPEIFKDE